MSKKLSFEEWSLERNRKREAPTVSASPTTENSAPKMSFEEWSAQRNKQPTNTNNVSLKKWTSNIDTFTKSARNYYANWNGMTPDTDRDIRKIAQNYLALANDYRAKYAGDEKSLKAISAYEKGLNDLLKYAEPKHKDAQGISSAYGISDTELEKKLADKDNPIAFTTSEGEKISWRGVKEQKDLSRLYGLSSEDLEKEQAKSGSGVAYTTMDGQNITWNALLRSKKKEEQYVDLSSRDDWDELSKYKSTIPSADADYNDPSLQAIDWAYELVNNPEYSSDRSDTFRAKYMTDEEREVFNYLYHTEGKDAALEWQYDLMHDLEELRSADIAKKANEYASQGFPQAVASWIGARAAAPLAAFEYVGDLVDSAFTGRSVRNDIATRNAAVDKAITDNVDVKIGNFDVFDFGYGTATSMVDSALSSALGSIGGAAVLGLSAAASATNAALDRGMDQKDAIKTGVLAGFWEGFFEHFSIGNFKKLKAVDPKRAKDYVFNTIKSMGINASEEGLTEIANAASDIYFNGDFSDYETSIRMNVQSGMTQEEARKEANKNLALQIAESAASGALMGIGFGAGGSAIGHAKAARQAKKLYGSDAGALVQKALEIDPENAYAKQMQEKLKDSKNNKLSGSNLAFLAKQNEAALVESDKAKIQQAVKTRLTELGATEDVDAVADALMKQAIGEKLTRRERDLIELNRYAPQVAEELDPAFRNLDRAQYDAEWAESHDNRWVQQIGTERINAEYYNRLTEPAQIAPETKKTEGDTVLDPNENIAEISNETAESPVSIENNGEFLNEGTKNATRKEDLQVAEESAVAEIEEGKAILNIGDAIESVDFDSVNPISAIRNGRMVLRLADGRTVSSDSVTHASADTNIVYNAARMLAPDAKTANVMVNGFKPGMNVDTYIKGIRLVHMYGKNNFDMADLLKSGSAKQLSADVRTAVYKAGQIAGGREVAAAQARINAAGNTTKATGKGGRVLFTDGGAVTGTVRDYLNDSGRKLKPVQEAGLLAMEKLAAALKTDLYVFESYINKDGKRVYIDENGKEKPAPNGFYDGAGKIFVDLNAGNMGEGTMLYTVAHELTHFIKEWSPAKFKTLANIVVKQYNGESIEKRIAQQIEKAKRSDRKIDYDTALEEVVADSMESILADGNVLQMVEDIKKQDRTLGEKIAEWFKNLAKELKSIVAAYSGYKPDSIEGQFVAKLETGLLKQIEQLYAEGLVDAGEARNAAITKDRGKQADRDLEADVKLSDRNTAKTKAESFTYESLVSKPDMVLVDVSDDPSLNRTGISLQARKNAAKIGRTNPKDGSVSVFVEDIGKDVVLSTPGLRHSLDRRSAVNTAITLKAGEILKNSIQINELTPAKAEAAGAYVLIGAAKNENGELCVVRSVVNRFSNELTSIDVLYAINAKKENRLRSMRPGFQRPVTDSTISIDGLLTFVNEYFPDILPESVLRHFGHGERPVGVLGKSALYSLRDGDSVSNRSLLANAFEGAVTNDIERGKIAEYREKMSLMEAEEQKLHRLNAEIKELSFAKGPRDKARIEKLRADAQKTANRINVYDGQLLRLEASKPLQEVLKREKAKAYDRAEKKGKAALQKQREAFEEKSEKMQKALSEKYRSKVADMRDSREKAEMKARIRKKVSAIDKLLNHGTKQKNVKEELKTLADATLEIRQTMYFLDQYTRKDMIRNGVGVDLSDKEADLMRQAQEALENGDEQKLERLMGNLSEVFQRERKRINSKPLQDLFTEIAEAYRALNDPNNPDYIFDAFDSDVYDKLVRMRDEADGTTVRDMSLEQLTELNDAYTMILTTIRQANRLFADDIKATREELSEAAISEIGATGKKRGDRKAASIAINSYTWNNEKPVYAFERIGSKTMTQLYENLFKGQGIAAKDFAEAQEYAAAARKKFGYQSWDLEKRTSFETGTGRTFDLSLGEMLSIYAYSKRDTAHKHLTAGGIVFRSGTKVVKDGKLGKQIYIRESAETYQLSDNLLGEIIAKLSNEQKTYVDAMQRYLSVTMGAKGNEVSMKLYGVKLYGEDNYFPMHVAPQYKPGAQQSADQKAVGQASLKNAGFTHSTVPNASDPIIIEDFMDVWSDHVVEMSNYHGMVLPLEDFRRVWEYRSKNQAGSDSYSVKAAMQNAFGLAGENYIDALYKDMNGGIITDPRESIGKKLVGQMKKASVFVSASVLIQQPSAIGRAFAEINPKYFVGGKVSKAKHNAAWKELKKYAPVAIIKEIGYFDTDAGRSAAEYLKKFEYSGLGQKAKAVFTDADYRDELLSKGPALADEVTWVSIWEAVKRETKALHKDMDVHSDEFLQIAGDRFSKIIDRTQVYDSVLSRSSFMRSKNVFMNMVTSFMAEPTTTANMVESAFRSLQKGDKGKAAGIMASVMTSMLLNSALVSIVRAARDDDEDETFLEKYAASFLSEVVDGINPMTYLPWLRDIWSAFQGYDVERADMSIFSNVISGATSLVTALSKDEPDLEKIQELSFGIVGDIANIFGLPVKNIVRDIRATVNAIKTVRTERGTTWNSLLDTAEGSLVESVPVFGILNDKSRGDRLYEAIIEGDEVYAERLKSAYKDESAVNSAVRKALRTNDSRIREAAELLIDQEYEEALDLIDEIIDEGNFTENDVESAVKSEVNAMTEDESEEETAEKAKSTVSAKDYVNAVLSGSSEDIKAVHDDVIGTNIENGKAEEDAEKNLISGSKTELKKRYVSGEIDKAQVQKALTAIGAEDVEQTVLEWTCEVVTGKSYDDHIADYKAGLTSASELSGKLTRYGGLSTDEAKKKIVDYSKDAYENGVFDRTKMIGVLVNYGGKDRAEAESVVQYMEYKKSHPDVYVNESWIDAYNKEIKNSGMNLDAYVKYREQVKSITGDGKKERRMAVIHSLPISTAQKDALYLSEGWAQSRLYEAPWH